MILKRKCEIPTFTCGGRLVQGLYPFMRNFFFWIVQFNVTVKQLLCVTSREYNKIKHRIYELHILNVFFLVTGNYLDVQLH